MTTVMAGRRTTWKAFAATLEELWRSCSSENDDDASYRPSLDWLPDEVLLMMLQPLSDKKLLPLRLVCKRWLRLVADGLLRRGRRPLPSGADPAEPAWCEPHPALLYTQPVLEALRLPHKSSLSASYRALAEGNCEVRSLSVKHQDPFQDSRLLVRALEKRSHTLRHLHFESLSPNAQPTPVKRQRAKQDCYRAIDKFSELTSLSLSDAHWANSSMAVGPCFETLHSLLRLHVGRGVGIANATGLLHLSRERLQSVCLGQGVRAAHLAGTVSRCAALRQLTLMACPDLDVLRGLPLLERLTVCFETQQDLAWLKAFLDRGRVDCELHLHLIRLSYSAALPPTHLLAAFDSCAEALGLKLQLDVDLGGGLGLSANNVIQCLVRLPALQVLTLAGGSDFEFEPGDGHKERAEWAADMVQRWTPRCAPSLSRLEVDERARGPWVEQLRVLYPSLEVAPPGLCWHEL